MAQECCIIKYKSIIKGGEIVPDIGDDKKTQTKEAKWANNHPILMILIGVIITSAFNWFVTIGDDHNRIDFLEKNISDIEDDISKHDEESKETLMSIEDDIREIEEKVNTFAGAVSPFLKNLRPTDLFENAISTTYDGIDAPSVQEPSMLAAKSMVAYNIHNESVTYNVQQVADKQMLLPYVENGQEVYFYGQLDAHGNWDGHCVVNIYEDDFLKLITDAQYENGNLQEYKQVFPDKTTNGQEIWVISERKKQDGFSSGVSWHYYRNGEYKKDFGLNDATVADMVGAEQFREEFGIMPEGYYCGNISGGYFNDTTGEAYMVKYLLDGTIRTLYVGNFKDGQMSDMTGNAWMIGKEDINKPYAYYNGTFNNGTPKKEMKYWRQPLGNEDIQLILEEKSFSPECSLNWFNPVV